jgi:hypothetical protein
MADTDYMLTTIDNPFNPYTHYDDWYAFDVAKGYNTCGLLARVIQSSDELSDADNALSIDEGMNEIIKYNTLGIHLKVTRDYVPRVREGTSY